jgi:glutathione S-transferase
MAEERYRYYWGRRTIGLAPLIVLEEGGLGYDRVDLDIAKGEHKDPAYLAVNPKGLVPTLVTPEGQVITEAAAISLYLSERHDLGLAPSIDEAERGRFLSLLMFLTNSLQTAHKPYHWAERFARDAADEPRVRALGLAEVERLHGLVEAELATSGGPFLLGTRYSLVDSYLAVLITWHPEPASLLARHRGLERCFRAVTSRPVVERVMRAADELPPV